MKPSSLFTNKATTQNKIRQHGIYYTTLFNPFAYKVFKEWMHKNHLNNEIVLEPFAGANSIITMLNEVGFAKKYQSYDLYPKDAKVQKHNTLADYPQGYKVCVTNPPWLYRSSAIRRGLHFPTTCYNDLYKLSLSIALPHNPYVAALVPASFLQSGLFRERLDKLIFLNRPLFKQTEMPVCLALFVSTNTTTIKIYNDDNYIGQYDDLKKKHLPSTAVKDKLRFNVPNGKLGLIAIDNTREPSIRFCWGDELQHYHIQHSSRSITRIAGVHPTKIFLQRLNDSLTTLRQRTEDVFLTPFKGLRKDGKYRRRLEFALARSLINREI